MLGSPSDRSIDHELGPPTLLKQLGNVLEANLVRARLESVGIPAFIAGPDAFALPAGHSSLVGLYVPEQCVAEALDVLDHPPADESNEDLLAYDDPGRPIAFRAIVASVAGWTIVFLTLVGLLLATLAFAYAIVLAVRALRRSVVRDRGLRLQVAAAIALSLLGLAMAALLGTELLSL